MRPLSLFLVLVLAGCASSAPPLPDEIAASITAGSNTVVVHSDLSVDELFAEARRLLVNKGFDFVRYSTEIHLIATDQVEIGQSTSLRIIVQAAPAFNDSQLEAVGYWADMSAVTMSADGPGSSGEHQHWERAEWQASERATRAFGQLALLFQDITHNEILYLTK